MCRHCNVPMFAQSSDDVSVSVLTYPAIASDPSFNCIRCLLLCSPTVSLKLIQLIPSTWGVAVGPGDVVRAGADGGWRAARCHQGHSWSSSVHFNSTRPKPAGSSATCICKVRTPAGVDQWDRHVVLTLLTLFSPEVKAILHGFQCAGLRASLLGYHIVLHTRNQMQREAKERWSYYLLL